MPRYKLTIEYDGTHLAGWQKQPDRLTVQGALESAIAKICGTHNGITAAGRTDAGVHALGQVAHVDLEKDMDAFRVREAINFHLREDKTLPLAMQIAVVEAEKVQGEFHARFTAKRRYYRYRIIQRRAHLALEQNRAWCVPVELDIEKMQAAADILLGQHDFTSFRSTDCQSKSPIKTLDELKITRSGDEVIITSHALSYLHHQVRNMVGTLKYIGTGKWQVDDMRTALEARDRRAAGPTAPAQGLYFAKVDY